MAYNIDEMLEYMDVADASDLHLKHNRCPLFRINGTLEELENFPVELDSDAINVMARVMMHPKAERDFEEKQSADFSYGVESGVRFRINIFKQRGHTGLIARRIPSSVPSLEQMLLPPQLMRLINRKQGLVLVTGPTGSGKSTTLAALIHEINCRKKLHVMTLEDPIEFYHHDELACINQREIGADSPTFADALRSVLRQDPDIILLGEMRDAETIQVAMAAAETGHLVLSTLHTNSAPATIDRIANVFAKEVRPQILSQLASVLAGVISQQLVSRKDGGLVAALEIMSNSPVVEKFIRVGATDELTPLIEKSVISDGMQSMNQALCALWANDVISEDVALRSSTSPDDLRQLYDRAFYLDRYIHASDEDASVLDQESLRRLDFLKSLPKFGSRAEEFEYFRKLQADTEATGIQTFRDISDQMSKLEEERDWTRTQYEELKVRLEKLKDDVDRREYELTNQLSKVENLVRMKQQQLQRLKTKLSRSSGGDTAVRRRGRFGK